MGVKHNIFKRHFESIDMIISHAPFAYFKTILLYTLIAIALGAYRIFYSTNGGIFYPSIVKIILGVIGGLAYISFLIKFFDIYLDSIIITPEWLFVHRRGGLLQNSQTMISRDGLESVSYTQNWLIENLFKFGDISLIHINGKDIFKDVPSPREASQQILNAKRKYTNAMPNIEEDRMQILIDALGEVVQEYLQKNYNDQWLDQDEFNS